MQTSTMISFINPATGEQFGQVRMNTPTEIEQSLLELRVAFNIWSQKPVAERVRILRQFQKVMIDSLEEISTVINQDTGKSQQDALIEVFMTADLLEQYCKRVSGWLRRQRVSPGLFFFKRAYIEHRPYGVVGVIAPWNYPFTLSIRPVLAALLAGNTVILKPSEVAAASGVMVEKLFQRVPELSPFVRVMHGDASVGEALVNCAPDFLFLTGSTLTGRKVSEAAARNLIPMTCELGGKDAVIVLEDASLAEAARWSVNGAFFNAGQSCVSIERAYVVADVYDKFLRLIVAETQKLRMGYSRDPECLYHLGPVADPRQVKIIQRQVEDALDKGARIVVGGGIDGLFVEPTILMDVDHTMLIMQDESFGPLLPVMKVKNEAEAVRLANDNAYGLGASIWSDNLESAQRVARQIEAASVTVNDTLVQFAVPMLPFGGIKQSGYGRVHGKEGLMQFTTPYSYIVGKPPLEWDITTLLRIPGHYRLGAALLRFLYGRTPRQRLQPVVDEAKYRVKRLDRTKLKTSLGILGILSVAAGLRFVLKKNKI